jgi:hypothetical protein
MQREHRWRLNVEDGLGLDRVLMEIYKTEVTLTRATMACFVEARENTFSILTPLMSSSIRPSSSAVLRRVANRLASRTRFFFDCDTEDLPASVLSRSASCSSRWRVARIEHLRQIQSVKISRRV